jgi:hypothetical protein
MKMINKRNVAKIILIVIVISLLLLIYKWITKESVNVIAVVNMVPEISQKEIVTTGHETIIQTFKGVEEVKWLDDKQLLIRGQIDEDTKSYVFDLEKQLLMPHNYSSNSEIIDDRLIGTLETGERLFINNASIIISSEDKETILVERVDYKGEDMYQISENASKLLYYNRKKDSLMTYHFEKKKYKIILENVPEIILDNFYKKVKLSPLGGYVSIEYSSEVLEENFFSIYGADSGKIYGDEIHGIDVSWSNDDLYLAYFYTKESEKIEAISDKIVSKRVGYYDVNNKTINYLDSTPIKNEMLSKLYWKEEKTAVLVGEATDKLKVTALVINDYNNQNVNEIPLLINDISLEATIDFTWKDDHVWVFIHEKDQARVYRVNTDNGDLVSYDGLKPFSLVDSAEVYYFYEGDKIITFQDDKIVLSDLELKRFAHTDGLSFKVIPHPTMKGFAMWLDEGNIIKIVIND